MSILTPLVSHILAAEATPSVITTVNPDGSFRGSPGIIGFIVTFIMAVAIILLGLDLTRRARRLRYRSQYALAREAEQRAQAEANSDNQEIAPVSPGAHSKNARAQGQVTEP